MAQAGSHALEVSAEQNLAAVQQSSARFRRISGSASPASCENHAQMLDAQATPEATGGAPLVK